MHPSLDFPFTPTRAAGYYQGRDLGDALDLALKPAAAVTQVGRGGCLRDASLGMVLGGGGVVAGGTRRADGSRDLKAMGLRCRYRGPGSVLEGRSRNFNVSVPNVGTICLEYAKVGECGPALAIDCWCQMQKSSTRTCLLDQEEDGSLTLLLNAHMRVDSPTHLPLFSSPACSCS